MFCSLDGNIDIIIFIFIDYLKQNKTVEGSLNYIFLKKNIWYEFITIHAPNKFKILLFIFRIPLFY